jgi:hypothetical protein
MKLTKAQREQIRGKFGGRCAYCGCPLGDRWHADHVEPVVRNDWLRKYDFPNTPRGPDYPERDKLENMNPACVPCNIDKHSMSLDGWRRKLQDACNVLARNNPTYRHAKRFGLLSETGAVVTFYFETQPAPCRASCGGAV